MPWFIKTERFTSSTMNLSKEERKQYLDKHRSWVIGLKSSGTNISSGYLVDERKSPGGGGLLILEAKSFTEAKSLIEKDPVIIAGLVTWTLQEWVPVIGELISKDDLR